MQIPPPKEDTQEFTLRQKLCLLLFLVTIGVLLYGTTQLGWYIDEIAAMFLMMMVITGVVAGYSATQIYFADHAGRNDLRHHRL